MEFKNEIYATPDGKCIRMNINHPKFGWIPYAALENGDELSKTLFTAAKERNQIRPYDADILREEELRRPG